MFPQQIKNDIGHALYAAQCGETDPAAKAMKGFGGGSVMEIVASSAGDTWRAVYTVRFYDAVYVLHAFQKEIQEGRCDTGEGYGFDPATPGRGGTRLQVKAELK